MQERITELEIKLAHLEQAVNELSDVLYRQQGMLDRLETGFEGLQQRVDASPDAANADTADEKPPHY